MFAGMNINVRQSLAKVMQIPTNGPPSAQKRQTQQRKTLMQSNVDENLIQTTGVQNSVFDLQIVESKLSKLGQIYLVLEHMLLIQSTLGMEKCKCFSCEIDYCSVILVYKNAYLYF